MGIGRAMGSEDESGILLEDVCVFHPIFVLSMFLPMYCMPNDGVFLVATIIYSPTMQGCQP
jgi:hypothetical protein